MKFNLTVLHFTFHCSPSDISCNLAGIFDEFVVILYWKATFLLTLLAKQVKTISTLFLFLIFENLQVYIELVIGYYLITKNHSNISFTVVHIISLSLS